MRLPDDVRSGFLKRFCVLGLAVLVAACGRAGTDIAPLASAADRPAAADTFGPEADYPLVVGDPYEVDGKLYTPLDTMNSDEVGYASLDRAGGNSVSVSHKTLPMPSYVEVTSLDSGKTILARVERRGPMSNGHVAALSEGALAQLGVQPGASIRIRRVNPPESDRSKLRMGQAAAPRMDTPKSLLGVLKRSLVSSGTKNLAVVMPKNAAEASAKQAAELPPAPATVSTAGASRPTRSASGPSVARTFAAERKTVTAYPLPPMTRSGRSASIAPTQISAQKPPAVRVTRNVVPNIVRTVPKPTTEGKFVVQAAAFSNKANAERAATALNGFVQKSGRFFRVRTGPFINRGQAEAALAKVRAAGYSDARVFTNG